MVPTGYKYNNFQHWQAVNSSGNGELATDGYIRMVYPTGWNLHPTWNDNTPYGDIIRMKLDFMPSHCTNGWVWGPEPTDTPKELIRSFNSLGQVRTACFPSAGSFTGTSRKQVTGVYGTIPGFIGLADCADAALKEFTDPVPIGIEMEPIKGSVGMPLCYAYFGDASDFTPDTGSYSWHRNHACVFKLFLLPGLPVGNEASFEKVPMGKKPSVHACAVDVSATHWPKSNGISWNAATHECVAVTSMEGVEPLYKKTSDWKSAFLWRKVEETTTTTPTTIAETTFPEFDFGDGPPEEWSQENPTNMGVVVGSAAGGLAALAGLGSLAIAAYRRSNDQEENALEDEEFAIGGNEDYEQQGREFGADARVNDFI